MGNDDGIDKQLQDIEVKIGTPARKVELPRPRKSASDDHHKPMPTSLLVNEDNDEPRANTSQQNLSPNMRADTPKEGSSGRSQNSRATSSSRQLGKSDGLLFEKAHHSLLTSASAPSSPTSSPSTSGSNTTTPPEKPHSRSKPPSPRQRDSDRPNIFEQAGLALANLFFHEPSHRRTVSLNRVRAKSRANELKAKELLEQQANEERETRRWLEEILPDWEAKKDLPRTKMIWERGLPTAVRGLVWSKALGNPLNVTMEKFASLLEEGRALRKYYLEDLADDSEGQSPFRLIQVDLPRTFAQTKLFEPGQPLHLAVTEILESVSLLCPTVGYVQGMSYVASMLLLVMDQYEAFVAMSAIINHPFFTSLYIMDVRQIVRHIKVYDLLFAYNLPRLFQRFQDLDISPEHYLLDWFLTIFSKAVPTKIASRIWDCFMLYGEVFLFVTALGILRHNRRFLMAASFEQCITKLKDLAQDVDEAELFKSINEIEIPDYVHEFIRRLNTIQLPSQPSQKGFPHLTNLLDTLIDKSSSSGALK